MAPSQMSHPEANMFADSVNPSFLQSEFKAAGHDFFSPTFNVNFTAPLSGTSLTHGESYYPELMEGGSKKHNPVSSRSPAGSQAPRDPGSKGVKRFLGFLSPRRQHSSLSEGSIPARSGGDIPRKTTARQTSYDADTPPLTPDLSSCASSPFSSQEDVTLVRFL